MIAQLLEGAVLVAITVAIHGAMMGWLLWRLRHVAQRKRTLLDSYVVLAEVAIWCVLAHLAEITIWALFYQWRDVMANLEDAVYFSAVTYATIGYGDVTPPADWRLLASMEGLTGILMCAWSGGFIFAIVSRLHPGAAAGQQR